jgi:hypothetical protein
MTKPFPSVPVRHLFFSGCLLILCGCPFDGRPPRSNCVLDLEGISGLYWLQAGIDHYLTEPSHCPIPLPASGWVYYTASTTAPSPNINDDYMWTQVYNQTGDPASQTVLSPWYLVDYGTFEADESFQYVAGTATPLAGEFSDRAVNFTYTSWNGNAVATAMLTYRKGLLASVQGPMAPTPGTNATWSLSVQNASAPYTYRWFKNDVELSGQTGSSLTLPVSSSYFTLKAITASSGDGADTLEFHIVPAWHVTIYGMADRSPQLNCNFSSDTGNNPSGSFTYQWYSDGVLLPDDGSTANPTFSLGSHTLELFVIDANGYMAKTSMAINVTADGPSNCM